MANKVNSVSLSELVEYVASELRKAKQESLALGAPVMQFNESELELTVTVTKEGE